MTMIQDVEHEDCELFLMDVDRTEANFDILGLHHEPRYTVESWYPSVSKYLHSRTTAIV